MKILIGFFLCNILLNLSISEAISQPSTKFDDLTSEQKDLASELGPPDEGMSRIVIKRFGILGAVVPHLIADRGDTTEYNALVIQNENYADFDGNFDKAQNVSQLFIKDENNRFHLIQGTPLLGDKLLTNPTEQTNTTLKFKDIIKGKNEFEMKYSGFWEPGQPVEANIRLTGVIKSGEIAAWDRKPGKVRIEVIVPIGDQGFCPSFIAEPGVTYFINYYYSKASFKISEYR